MNSKYTQNDLLVTHSLLSTKILGLSIVNALNKVYLHLTQTSAVCGMEIRERQGC